MDRKLTICFTSDIHGYFSDMDYAQGLPGSTGLSRCASAFPDDGNTLILDGGDTLQGSPFAYWLSQNPVEGAKVSARAMSLAGYDFVTIGNHDFNYGKETLESYLGHLDARCVSANVEGVSGVERTAVVKLQNGLRVGITGVTTHFVNLWEKPENLEGITVNEAFPAAAAALEELKQENVDVTVCIYHGGFENDLVTGELLSNTSENQAYRICKELNFDVLLTGHQHQSKAGLNLFGTYTAQSPDRARQYVRMDVAVSSDGKVTAESQMMEPGEPEEELAAYLAPLDAENAIFLDQPLGELDIPLEPGDHMEMAVNGSVIANFFNQVQLDASGADLSITCLANVVKGFNQQVTIRDVVATYVFPNTLKTIRVDRKVLKAALERCAEYFALDENGQPQVSQNFLKPIVMHYNYDYLSGMEVTMDIRRPVGDRVTSMLYKGKELEEDRQLTLCLNNYRATGTGGYPLYAQCELVKDQPTEISQMIIEYIAKHKKVTVDKSQWLHVVNYSALNSASL